MEAMANHPVALGGRTLDLQFSATTNIPLADGRVVAVPVGIPPETAAAAILAASGSLYCVAPTKYSEMIANLNAELTRMKRSLNDSDAGQESLKAKFFALDKEANSLRLRILATDKENAALRAELRDVQDRLESATTNGDALRDEVERLRTALSASQAAHAVDVEKLTDEVADLQRQIYVRDSRIDALERGHKTMTADMAVLRDDNATLRMDMASMRDDNATLRVDTSFSHLETELSRVGEFASLLEARLVKYVWPGATAHRSPVAHLGSMRYFFETYLDSEGRLKPGASIPKRFSVGPKPLDALLGGDADALVETHARWERVIEACPDIEELITPLKTVRGKIAHIKPPPASSPTSLLRALDVAHKEFLASGAGVDDERVAQVHACLEPLEGLTERLQLQPQS